MKDTRHWRWVESVLNNTYEEKDSDEAAAAARSDLPDQTLPA